MQNKILARKKQVVIRDHQAERQLFINRAIVVFIGILLLVGVLIANMYHIQINQHQAYQTRSNDNRIKIIPIAPNRGLIYDRNGILLAENRPVYTLEITTEKVIDIDQTIAQLQEILPISNEHISNFKKELKRTRYFKSIPLLTQLNEEQVALFSVNKYKFNGVEINAELKRYYPYGNILTHVLGYVARVNDSDMKVLIENDQAHNYRASRDIGKLGIEKYYEHILHGQSGYKEVEVNSVGRIIRVLKYVSPIAGQDLILNLDINLQTYVHDLIDGRRGSVVVLDPKDNGILAMVSSPSYDPNVFVHGISSKEYSVLLKDPNRPLINRATLGIYPPASTIKPFIAISALQEKVVTPHTTRNDPGYWHIPDSNTRPFRDWMRWGHGKVNLVQSLEESVDTFFYQIAYDMGIDRLSTWMNHFGFGKSTGIDIFEESKANMPTREWKMLRHRTPWYKGDTIPVGIGQGYWTATPIQLANATSILVNKGSIIAPHFLKATILQNHDFDQQITQSFKPLSQIQGVPKQYWDIAKEGMRLVNHGMRGTARKSFTNMSYQTAGKSGTAQVFGLNVDEEYNAQNLAEHLRDHALFTGFAPVLDPKIVVTVVLENAGGGSSYGAPITRKIFDHILLDKDKTAKNSSH